VSVPFEWRGLTVARCSSSASTWRRWETSLYHSSICSSGAWGKHSLGRILGNGALVSGSIMSNSETVFWMKGTCSSGARRS
jgi:hypothetical protein